MSAKEKKPFKLSLKQKLILGLILAVIILVAGVVIYTMIKTRTKKPEILTSSSLEEVIKLGRMDTFKESSEGLAMKFNKEKPSQTDYYVTYQYEVKAGIDFDKITIERKEDEERILIIAHVPEVTLADPVVDINSLDFLFVNKKANNENAQSEAYKFCEADAKIACKEDTTILDCAKRNAEIIIEGLLNPFIKDAEKELEGEKTCELQIEWEVAEDEK